MYAVYIYASMLPLIIPAFALLVYAGLVPTAVLKAVVVLVALDYAIPLSDPSKPHRAQKEWLERIFAEGTQHYSPARSVFLPRDGEIKSDRSYILAAWPHGLMGGGTHAGIVEFGARGLHTTLYSGASVLMAVPFVRRFFSWFGFVDASKSSLVRVLDCERGTGPNIVHLVVGGIQEMYYTTIGDPDERIIIQSRKGFVKLAIRTGSDLIPMYNFGANQAYSRLFGRDSPMRNLSSKLRVSLVAWLGRWNVPMGFLPRKVPLLGVIGPVFEVPRVSSESEITDELVEKTHAAFCVQLRRLFDEYKVVYVEDMGADPVWLTRKLKFEDE